jgi:hypothetical protein
VRARARACAQDPNILVQRRGLEVMLSHLPLSAPPSGGSAISWNPLPESNRLSLEPSTARFADAFPGGRVDLAMGALRLALLHDMSLNRRLYAWLFPQSSTAAAGAVESSVVRKVRCACG